jgi:hypothetical protein
VSSDAATIATQTPVTTRIHVVPTSLPVPSVCSNATGQDAYASQCVARQARQPMWRRSRLVTSTAPKRSSEIAPSPIQNGRSAAPNGMKASTIRVST